MGILISGRLILASASPRRAELLRVMGLDFDIIPSHIDESLAPGETPQDHVLRLARDKADDVGNVFTEDWILGADTIVVIDDEILGKPADPVEAGQMLGRLSGRVHEVYTGFTLLNHAARIVTSQSVRSSVTFRNITEDEIKWYTETPEPYDKAGSYAVQGLGAFFIKEIHGSYTNVMGLPLCEVVDILKEKKILTFL
ncbi:MAG: Maf family protein [Syntrophales bacterium]|nr:Maf family protein [Syntrophales bacterium]